MKKIIISVVLSILGFCLPWGLFLIPFSVYQSLTRSMWTVEQAALYSIFSTMFGFLFIFVTWVYYFTRNEK